MRLRVLVATVAVVLPMMWAAAPVSAAEPSQRPAGDNVTASQDPCDGLIRKLAPRCAVARLGEQVAGAVAGVGTAVTASVFEQLYEWVVAGASWLLRELVSLIDSSTRPNLLAGWFRAEYGLMASLATLLALPVLLVATIGAVVRQDWSGLGKSYFVYLPVAAIGAAVAVPLTDMGLAVTDWMSRLFLAGMRPDIEGFLDGTATTLAGSQAADAAASVVTGVPLFLAFLGAIIIALGAFAVWVELVLRSAGIYVAVFFLPLGFASLVWPRTRTWFGRLVKTIVALILSKFVIVAVLALASAALSSLGAAGFGAVISGAALMLMAAFSPLVLFRMADIAGDDVASAFAGVTQGRTSPIWVPDQHSAARMYQRIMSSRPAVGGGASLAGAGAAAGLAGPASAMRGTRARAAAVPERVGTGAGERLAEREGSETSTSGEEARPGSTGSETAASGSGGAAAATQAPPGIGGTARNDSRNSAEQVSATTGAPPTMAEAPPPSHPRELRTGAPSPSRPGELRTGAPSPSRPGELRTGAPSPSRPGGQSTGASSAAPYVPEQAGERPSD